MAEYDLVRLKREILVGLGRRDEALEDAWAGFCSEPSKYTYADFMAFVPEAERGRWHEKAIEAAQVADLHPLMELLVETGELERLAALVRRKDDHALERLSHGVTGPAAEKLEETHPGVAARLWRAQGMRIVTAKKSGYYDAAIANFESAKRCFERAGLADEWEKTVRQVRADHRRKYGFMPGFERLVAGAGPSSEPSFLERAKVRWGRPPGGGKEGK
jgi:hypothetical protein